MKTVGVAGVNIKKQHDVFGDKVPSPCSVEAGFIRMHSHIQLVFLEFDHGKFLLQKIVLVFSAPAIML